jgi:hypothetical protein
MFRLLPCSAAGRASSHTPGGRKPRGRLRVRRWRLHVYHAFFVFADEALAAIRFFRAEFARQVAAERLFVPTLDVVANAGPAALAAVLALRAELLAALALFAGEAATALFAGRVAAGVDGLLAAAAFLLLILTALLCFDFVYAIQRGQTERSQGGDARGLHELTA